MDPATTLGPLSTEAALLQLLDQVEDAVANGATLLMGGKRIDRPGSYMQPTILANIRPGNPAFREEFFGPVALFFRVKNEDEAVALANDSEFGLGGSVFTEDIERGKRVASRIDTGMVFINHPTWTASDLPFGGIKNSGYGRELSSMGIQEFVNKKLVRVASIVTGRWKTGHSRALQNRPLQGALFIPSFLMQARDYFQVYRIKFGAFITSFASGFRTLIISLSE
jgi:succinate-semialdehyde dehydrogenase/glutarate-semialdehyde dehydrogenase